ncbi:flagellar filament capping protein FliD [Desulfovibrio aminophilus]|uniref:flagellar filament capping protein FliD n=1 Tax=Desulfovibrio aminophilus TaxID=81425 RepID=UPI003393C3F5
MADDTSSISAYTSAYTSGNVNFTGLGNGTDFSTLIDGLVKAESTHLTQLQTWRATWDKKITAFQELNTSMLALKTALEKMDTMNEFLTKNASSTNSTVLTATADSAAEEGTHKVEINQLAQNKIMATVNGYSSGSSVINSSGGDQILQYVYKGTTYNLTVPNGTTVDGLVNLINNQPANPGVKALAIFDGSNYYVQFRGMDLGVDASLTIGAGTTLTGFNAADWTTTQNNQNSQIRVDGWPTSGWISNAANSVNNVIAGLTLNLKDSAPGSTVTLTVGTDLEAVKENIRTFVTQMNTVRSKIQELTKYDDLNKAGSLLTGNYGVDIVSQNLKNIVADKGIGFISYNTLGLTEDTYVSLGQIGISTDAQTGSATMGMLVLDEEKLDEVLTNNPTAVAKLFSADDLGESKSSAFSCLSLVKGTTQPGEYQLKVKVKADGSGIESATINGHAAKISGDWEITGAAATPEAGLAIRLDSQTAGSTYDGMVTVKRGKTGELANELKSLTDKSDGPLAILQNNYKDIIKSIDNKIDYETTRLEKYRTTLKNKYARLDSLLGYYDKLNSQLTSSIKQLSSSSSS